MDWIKDNWFSKELFPSAQHQIMICDKSCKKAFGHVITINSTITPLFKNWLGQILCLNWFPHNKIKTFHEYILYPSLL